MSFFRYKKGFIVSYKQEMRKSFFAENSQLKITGLITQNHHSYLNNAFKGIVVSRTDIDAKVLTG